MPETTPILAGYHLTEKLYDGTRTLIYRGQRETDHKPVVIKFLKNEYPSFNELVQFRNQYTIAKNLDLPGIIHPYALENYHNGFALIMEEAGAIALSEYVTSNPLTLEGFFNIAIAIVKVLEGLYQNRVIHKDIKPHNILIHPETKEVKLIDFSISSLLPRETQEIQSPNVLEGTLAYLSPEQTGRMNRGIDYRTDFYSLGVSFYELLTGRLPFQSEDSMELVHCHIAQTPRPPMQINQAIPQMVNDLIMKLMAKTAEDRYQSANGLKYDLERCQQQWENTGQIKVFSLAQRDISGRFQIPEKLYGREIEVATLLSAFERVSDGQTEMMLVAGFSGIGKTALVNEVHKPIVRQRGYFIKGKFDQFKRDIPFSAFVQAFQNFMRQLLTESAEQVQTWKTQIMAALGHNGQVIIDVIPELEQIIGPQPPIPELEGNAAQNRFNLEFHHFINVFTTAEHPLVIFLDDLQWIDSASLKLIQSLMGQTDTHYLLLMGAYRDNEVNAAHPLILTLEDIRKTEALVNQITLGPLKQPDLNLLVADTLSCPTNKAIPLTELLIQKTQGNPFFTDQFLKFLYEEGLITFDLTCGYWECDLSQVKLLTISDDVVEFMAHQLQKLPLNTQEVLKLAACIGNQFDLSMLAIVYEKSQSETASDLWKALQEGLILPINEVYKFFQSSELSSDASDKEKLSVPYKFLHDRVQQAAYSLITETEKPATHLKIGRLLKSHTHKQALDDNLFDIVNQLNQGISLITTQTERDELIQLNLKAGIKAKASTAYVAANRYLTMGIQLLSNDSWETQYDLTLALYELATESAYLSGDFARQAQLAEIILEKAKTLLEQVKTYLIQGQVYLSQHKQIETLNMMLSIMKQLGIVFPEQPNEKDIEFYLQETQLSWEGKAIDSLSDLPMMTEKKPQSIMQILSLILAPAYEVAPELFLILVCQQVRLSIKSGNTDDSAYSYATYGMIVGDIETGYKFGQLALRVLEKLNAKKLKAKVYDVVEGCLNHWKIHFRKTLKGLQEGYQTGVEFGDFEAAGYCALQYDAHSYYSGRELDTLEREMAAYTEVFRQLKQEIIVTCNEIFRQATLNLIEQSDTPYSLIGEAYNEEKMLPIHQEKNDLFTLYCLYVPKVFLSYLFQAYRQTIDYTTIAEEAYVVPNAIMGGTPLFYLSDSLARLALYLEVDEAQQQAYLDKVNTNQEKMQDWAKHAPMNHQHKFDLVEAEKHRVLGQYLEAMDDYDRAIAGAKENEYIQEQALANEVAARFYLSWGKEKIAQTYMTEAYYGYARWGAKAKIADLEKRYPKLLAPLLTRNDSPRYPTHKTTTTYTKSTVTVTGMMGSELLDFASVMKASQAISDERGLEQFIRNLMRIVSENVGAERGVLILEKQNQFSLQAIALAQSESFDVQLHHLPLEQAGEQLLVPRAVINTVLRTQKPLVLNDATREESLTNDRYLIEKQPKSVIAQPILYHGKLTGVLYLENNLISDAFTSDRLTVLKLLASQIAISLENATYANHLEEKVAERTAQLAAANEEITGLNKRLEAENMRMSAELDVARQLQKMVLPDESELEHIKALDIAGFMEPADEVGGDYYDIIEHDGHVKIGIGDVTGHGLESGVLMLMVQMAVQTLLTTEINDSKTFLNLLNRAVYNNIQRLHTDKNLTLSLLDYDSGKLRLTGQHEDVLLVHKNGQVDRIDTIDLGFMVGLKSDITPFVSQREIQLEQGEGIVLYTDGITEAQNTQCVEYGMECLCDIVSQNWHKSAKAIQEAVIADVREHIGTQKVEDDITLLVIKQK
jgi:predicted ATPase/serine phosphatase RsbU (regulator of sigma subunit)